MHFASHMSAGALNCKTQYGGQQGLTKKKSHSMVTILVTSPKGGFKCQNRSFTSTLVHNITSEVA